ncbi:MAG: hypothetical protein ABI182_07700 [Candidatus Baltobacteraceae bacterium]
MRGPQQAQELANALNLLAKGPQFSYVKARATARKNAHVNASATKAHNEDFNPDVDGCETFVMLDGSICEWHPGQQRYSARPAS